MAHLLLAHEPGDHRDLVVAELVAAGHRVAVAGSHLEGLGTLLGVKVELVVVDGSVADGPALVEELSGPAFAGRVPVLVTWASAWADPAPAADVVLASPATAPTVRDLAELLLAPMHRARTSRHYDGAPPPQ